jgi:hypothetical protein
MNDRSMHSNNKLCGFGELRQEPVERMQSL